MKYIITIIGIIVVFSIAAITIMWPDNEPEDKDVVMTVNNLKVTDDMIESFKRHQSSHHGNLEEFLNSIAIEQILIQEAQRQKIDSEPAFREAIKTFYEQSLIKVLVDRQNEKLDDSVSDEEIDDYLSCFGKTFSFSRTQGKGPISSPELDWSGAEKNSSLFDELSSTLQPVLAGLAPGESRTIFDTGNDWYAVRVDSISEETSQTAPTIPREMVRKIIADYKRQQKINSWINTLIANAKITIRKETE